MFLTELRFLNSLSIIQAFMTTRYQAAQQFSFYVCVCLNYVSIIIFLLKQSAFILRTNAQFDTMFLCRSSTHTFLLHVVCIYSSYMFRLLAVIFREIMKSHQKWNRGLSLYCITYKQNVTYNVKNKIWNTNFTF